MLGRGRGRVPAHDLRSSSRARLSISNCLSCSRTEASREAVLAHCSIHTLRVEQRTGQGRINTTEPSASTRTRSRDGTDQAEPNTLSRNSPVRGTLPLEPRWSETGGWRGRKREEEGEKMKSARR